MNEILIIFARTRIDENKNEFIVVAQKEKQDIDRSSLFGINVFINTLNKHPVELLNISKKLIIREIHKRVPSKTTQKNFSILIPINILQEDYFDKRLVEKFGKDIQDHVSVETRMRYVNVSSKLVKDQNSFFEQPGDVFFTYKLHPHENVTEKYSKEDVVNLAEKPEIIYEFFS